MSTKNRDAIHASLIRHIRQFIAGAILFNQKIADQVGLRLTDMQCMGVLDLIGPSTPGKLAECTGLTTGGVTVMLDRLEKAGYVKRERNPDDRRSVIIHLNEKKLQKMGKYYEGVTENTIAQLAEFSVEDLSTIISFFDRMNSLPDNKTLSQKSSSNGSQA